MHLSVISLIVISILLNLSTWALLIRASKKSDEIMKDRECVFSLNEILSNTLYVYIWSDTYFMCFFF